MIPGYIVSAFSESFVAKWKRFDKFSTDCVTIIRSDLIVILNQIEGIIEWFVRDWEDLLFPWIPFSTRYELDSKVYPYTLCIQQLISLTADVIIEAFLIFTKAKNVRLSRLIFKFVLDFQL